MPDPARIDVARIEPAFLALGLETRAHAMRAAAATDALGFQTASAEVHGWLGHVKLVTIRINDRLRAQPEGLPTFTAAYCPNLPAMA